MTDIDDRLWSWNHVYQAEGTRRPSNATLYEANRRSRYASSILGAGMRALQKRPIESLIDGTLFMETE